MRFGAFLIAASLCSCASVKLPNSGTASEQFAGLNGNGQRTIAKNFYELGASDAVKRLYWAQRRVQETGGGQAEQGVSLQRRFVSIPVPEHVEPDGTIKEANNQIVEVVQIWKAVPGRHGGTLFLCK
jgi:hypothetical protein